MNKEQTNSSRELTVLTEPAKDGVEKLIIPELEKEIPVFEIHNLTHQEKAAQILATGGKIAIYGGVWGVINAVPRRETDYGFLEKVKVGRPAEAKSPMLVLPEQAIAFVDFDKVHKNFRFLEKLENFEKLWSTHGAFLHIIAPIKDNLETIDEVFKTTPTDFAKRYSQAPPINVTTAAFISTWNPYWRHFSYSAARYFRTDTHIEVSTLNPHGEEPPYTSEELKHNLRIGKIPAEDLSAAIKDDRYEALEAFSSHTQIMLPLAGDKPVFKVVRIGSLSPDGFAVATGFDYEIIPGATDVRKIPGVSLDEKLVKMAKDNNRDWNRDLKAKKPQVFFRT